LRVPSDSYLRLIPKTIADAIVRSSAGQCRAFAVACADLAVEHCTNGVLGLDDGGEMTVAALRDHVRAVVGKAEGQSVDRMLARREDTLWAQLSAMRSEDGDAPYGEFVRVATLRHAVRSLRAALAEDWVAAAASAAFETISATRSEGDVESLTSRMLAPHV
jgi:hypothetical protein